MACAAVAYMSTHLLEQVAEHALGLLCLVISGVCGIVHSSLALVLGLPRLALSLRCTFSQCVASLISCLLALLQRITW